MFSISWMGLGIGFAAGWFLRDTMRPKDPPLVDAVRKMIKEKEKKSEVVDVDKEMAKLKE